MFYGELSFQGFFPSAERYFRECSLQLRRFPQGPGLR